MAAHSQQQPGAAKRRTSKDKKSAKNISCLRDVSQGSVGSMGSNVVAISGPYEKQSTSQPATGQAARNQYTRYISDLRKLAHTRKSQSRGRQRDPSNKGVYASEVVNKKERTSKSQHSAGGGNQDSKIVA